jgi:hypothetical protein
MLAITAQAGQVIISCSYDETGLAWVDLFDNPVLGWVLDDSSVTTLSKPTPTIFEAPVIVGLMTPAPTDTTPILSPQWVHFAHGIIYVPDLWRGNVADFLTWMATNNGAQRKVRANFTDPTLTNVMYEWGKRNEALFNETPF